MRHCKSGASGGSNMLESGPASAPVLQQSLVVGPSAAQSIFPCSI